MKVKQNTSILERLKICWNVLTKKNYIYFGISRDPIMWKENGEFDCTKKGALKCYCYVDDSYEFNTNEGMSNLHDKTWKIVENFAKLAQEGKF